MVPPMNHSFCVQTFKSKLFVCDSILMNKIEMPLSPRLLKTFKTRWAKQAKSRLSFSNQYRLGNLRQGTDRQTNRTPTTTPTIKKCDVPTSVTLFYASTMGLHEMPFQTHIIEICISVVFSIIFGYPRS
jgi:hypothetical protein